MAVTLADIRRASNPHRNYNYEFVIPSPPGGANGDVMRLLVNNANIPGFGVEPIESDHYGFKFKHAGKDAFPRTLTVEYEEDNTLVIQTALWNWKQLSFNTRTAVQASTVVYKTDGFLKLLGLDRQIIRQWVISGMFVESVPDVPVGGTTSDSTKVSVTFSYDFADLL